MAAKIGQWAFMVGVLIAVVIGLFSSRLGADLGGWLVLLLVVLGLIVGLLNVTERETTPFLVAAAALMLTGLSGDTLSNIPKIGSYLSGIVVQIAVFVTPAAIVVALKAIQSLAKE
ncbi:hypothetical protein J4204_06500 [Candidatus Woesearchaeota archaeon]|nr:hypothetical protein [Candidatus Woesearchaeota archaeon]